MDRPFKPVAASKLGIVLLPPLKQSSRHVEASLQSVSYKSSHLSSDEEEEASDLGDLAAYRQKRCPVISSCFHHSVCLCVKGLTFAVPDNNKFLKLRKLTFNF